MNVRIQTYGKIISIYSGKRKTKKVKILTACIEGTAVDALKKGLSDLQAVCDVVEEEFTAKKDQYNAENGIDR